MKILMLSSEAVPFAKTGGLADVVTALAESLAAIGNDARIVIPLYASVPREGLVPVGEQFTIPVGVESVPVRALQVRTGTNGVVCYFIENPALYDRSGVYGDRSNVPFPDNVKRFAALNRSVFNLCRELNWIPDIIHSHDWPACLAPLYLNRHERADEFSRTASVLTIHNIGYQGIFPRQDLFVTQLPWESLRDRDTDDCTSINFLRAGIRSADLLTTVSPTYASEIQSAEYGAGMDRLLSLRSSDLSGILNGIDQRIWDPAGDPLIPYRFDSVALAGKARDKAELQAACGFPKDPDLPVIGLVSRLVDQKGFVELAGPGTGSLHRICSGMAVQIVILGTGEPWCEQELKALESRLPNLRVYLEYNDRMAHLIEAGSDFFLMPSRYEPCGLNQMYSLRYGTLPIVRNTGGLADTVEQYDPQTGRGTGFLFDDLTPGSIHDVVGWAVWAWYNRRDHIDAMRVRAMQRDFSWGEPARGYVGVYERALEKRRRSSG